MKQIKFNKNEVLTGTVVDLTHEGAGVVKIEDYPFFVEGALPGEEVSIKVMKVGKTFGFARLEKVLTKSADRVEEKDIIGRQVGTMTLQHMSYDAQLKFKQHLVESAFIRLGKFKKVKVWETVGMDYPYEYRNKAQIPVRSVNGNVETGFFRKNSHQLVPVENFYIQHKAIDEAIVKVRDILRKYDIVPYNERNHNGEIRHIVVKRGHYTGQLMIILVTNKKRLANIESITHDIVNTIDNVESVVLNFNNQEGNVILGRNNTVLHGTPYYTDKILGLEFRVSPNSFFQVNTPQAETLYKLALEAANLKGHETVLDAYCGIGTISLALAQHAEQVYAMEIVHESIKMAKQNAKMNGIDNVHFETGSADEILPKWSEQGVKFDVAVVDPPRKGLDDEFIQTLINQSPKTIVYVSCNPGTCARDCRKFADAGYKLEYVKPVDLFPQTPHVECVVKLTK
ncbi:23S rRNA (uracil(1939)-C(5))-methyltransferase RlmD [Macrococcoides caseolyticum]|uniref:23S rRNA (uracil(1939)-C(5))-methyltransferase RlmD n=1 Tax=Macrococcoides caseolyticum TaxID=69966 RepID=UPI000C337DFA|nr:23S rRNA (uracil(1939)-C(5))-methyltransferase RlmD [Macrococcus caseolyticus]PKE44427.1 23S rRNA (uracil(1939)-C(5))-methyltransferase RlmD [Macrococcus caseolyticus]